MKLFEKNAFTFLLVAALVFGMAMPTQAVESGELTEVEEQVSGGVEGYVEGEAIVCVQESQMLYGRRNAAGGDLLAGAETLMTLENSTSEAAGTDEASPDGAVALFRAASEAPVESLKLVRSDELSTEELIDQLEELDQVVFAEPNYIFSAADTTSGDYTDLQWGYDAGADSQFDINIPDWNTSSAVDTTGAVVAVMDTGIDYKHEDLKNVMWKADGLQSTIGGGEYGYNAVSANSAGISYDPGNPMDDNSHGTHCAGIIAAEWYNYGISGAAKGAKVMAVKVANDRGVFMTSNIIKGFEYVKRAKENHVNVTATSNSWGGISSGMQSIDRVVTELGMMGVVSVFASGNETTDCDTNSMTNAMLKNNPYAVIVNATDINGNMAYFSNYGAVTTDVAAPGHMILSTIPTNMAALNHRLPTTATPLKEEAFADNPATQGVIEGELFQYQSITGDDTDNAIDLVTNFDSSGSAGSDGSVKIALQEGRLSAITVKGELPTDCKYITLQYYGDPDGDVSASAYVQASVLCTGDTQQSYPASSGTAMHWNRSGIALPANTDYKDFEMTIYMSIMDSKSSNKFGGSVYIDDITLYDEEYGEIAVVPYGYKSGTSMSTPAVAGVIAIVAAKFHGDPADKWAARVIGSVEKIDSQKGMSVSEGLVDVKKALDGDYVPVLNSAAADENGTLTVEGYFFGTREGTLKVSGEEVGIISWEDEKITAKVPSELASGVHRVEVTTSVSKSGHQSFELALPGNLYERIALPEDEGLLSLKQANLTGLGGSLYLSGYAASGVFEIWCYTPEQTENKGWTKVYQGDEDKLTTGVDTACTWEGQLLLIVQEFDVNSATTDAYKIGLFDPGTGTMKTVKACPELQSMFEFSMINNGKDILLIGGYQMDEQGNIIPLKTVYKLDVETGEIKLVGNLSKARYSPAVACTAEGDVYVAVGLTSGNEYVDGLERISPDGTITTVRDQVLPSVVSKWDPNQDHKYSFAAVDGGMMLAGPAIMKDGMVTADVYTLDFDSGEFTPTNKIVSTSRLFEPVATAYQNVFYVLGNTTNALPHEKVFAADRSVKTVKQPGDSYVPTEIDTMTEEPGKGSGTDTGDSRDMTVWFCILISSLLSLGLLQNSVVKRRNNQ